MHIGRHIVQELVLNFGQPEFERWDVPLTAAEMDEIEKHRELGRAHDVSLAIVDGARVAVVRKRGWPAGAYSMPSGGIHPEESFVDGAAREALEQTGLHVRLEGYLLQVHASFASSGRVAKWTTHVMLARAESEVVAPRDLQEIEEARWLEWPELLAKVSPVLSGADRRELQYRARLHEKVYELVPRSRASRAAESPGKSIAP